MPTNLEDLERRVTALERAQNDSTVTLKWVVGTLGKIQAVQDHHTGELGIIKTDVAELKADMADVKSRLGSVENRLGIVESKLDALPRVLAEMLDERDRRKA